MNPWWLLLAPTLALCAVLAFAGACAIREVVGRQR